MWRPAFNAMAAAVHKSGRDDREFGGASRLAGRCVLLVEDDWLVAQETSWLLSTSGALVAGPAHSLDAAMALIVAGGLDAALLNVSLRGAMSYPVADALRDRSIPFAFLTGYPREVLPSRFRETPHWEKPFDPRRALAELLAARKD